MVRRRGRDHLFKKQDSEEELRKMKLITVGREFGSGGRELGKRLADTLGFAYYDRELISACAYPALFPARERVSPSFQACGSTS